MGRLLRNSLHAGTALLMAAACGVGAQEAKPAAGAAGAGRPLLKQLNEETQSLYREVQAGVVRVQLPPPRWAGAVAGGAPGGVIEKWGDQLNPVVRKRLEDEQKELERGRYRRLVPAVTTQPITTQAAAAATQQAGMQQGGQQPGQQQGQQPQQQAVGSWTMSTGGDDVLVFRPNGSGAGALRLDAGGGIDKQGQIVVGGGRMQVDVTAAGSFTPNNIGLLLDGEGHVLVPICVEKEAVGDEGVRVMVGPGQMATATFVGSDRQTNVTVLKLNKLAGQPVKLAEGRPAEGALTMFLSPNSGVGRLMIWTNELRDWGVVVGMEGGVYGFARQGQFLSAAACRPAVRQLVAAGVVKRPKLGVGIAEVPQNDAAREGTPLLGTQPACRVSEVTPNSPAARSGLKVGDLILELNDQPVGDPSSFAAALGQRAEQGASLKLLRAGREERLTIEPTAAQ